MKYKNTKSESKVIVTSRTENTVPLNITNCFKQWEKVKDFCYLWRDKDSGNNTCGVQTESAEKEE